MIQTKECGLCLEDFKDEPERIPKIMKCGHSFCVKCINSLIRDEAIICPICKSIIAEQIDEMPINKFALQPKKNLFCEICLEGYSNDPNSKKLPRILKCGDTFCTECLEKSRINDKIICPSCKAESCEKVDNLYINNCVIEEYENEITLNFKYMKEKDIDIKNLDFNFSVGLMGESAGGKTSIAHYFYTEKYLGPDTVSTIGIDYHFKFAKYKDKTIKIILWDTAGQEKFNSVSAHKLRGVQALLLVFSLTPINHIVEEEYREAEGEEKLKIQKEYTQKAFKDVLFWLTQFKTFNNLDKRIIFLIGNKCDDTESRIINYEDATSFAKKHKLIYFETSAKTGQNIKKVFENLSLKLMELYPKKDKDNQPEKNIILDKNNHIDNNNGKKIKKKKCC